MFIPSTDRLKGASRAALAAALFTLAPAAAHAQAAGDIVVTAQKREQRLQDVPAAISVLNADAIENAAPVNIENLITLVPNLTFNKGGTTLNSSLFLRGVGTINFSIAAEPSVAFVLDGVVMARAGEAFGDLYDLERIEVLRGPQGTLFGKNASAGVVNVISRKPGDVFAGQVDLGAFEGEEYRAKASVDLPIAEGLATRITAFRGEYDGNLKNVFAGRPETINGYERWGVRAVTTLELDTVDFTVIADYRKADDDCCTQVVGTAPTGAQAPALLTQLQGVRFLGDETRTVNIDRVTRTEETAWGLSGQADFRLASGHTLTSITAYRSWENTEIREGDWRSNPAAYVGNAFAQVHDVGPQDSSTISQELRIASPAEWRLTYVAGLYLYASENERTFRRDVLVCDATTLTADATGLAPCRAGASTFTSAFSEATFGSELTNTALFGQAEYKATDALTLIGGLRYTRDEVSYFHDRIPAPRAGLPAVTNLPSGFRGSVSEEDLSGRLGASYAVNDRINAYATYTRGYKGPAFNTFFNQNTSQLNPIEAETANAFEAGLKTTWLDGRVLFNAAAFTAEYDNFQANSPDLLNGQVITRLTNAGLVSTTGVEFDWLVNPIENLNVSGGLAYTDAQIEEFNDPATGRRSSARAGEPLAFAPKWKGSLAADYRLVSDALPVDVLFAGNYAYVDEQRTAIPAGAANPLTFIDAYGVLDASIGISDKADRYRLTLVGKNLTDESYASLIETGGPGGALLFRIPREANRYYGVTLRAKFGG